MPAIGRHSAARRWGVEGGRAPGLRGKEVSLSQGPHPEVSSPIPGCGGPWRGPLSRGPWGPEGFLMVPRSSDAPGGYGAAASLRTLLASAASLPSVEATQQRGLRLVRSPKPGRRTRTGGPHQRGSPEEQDSEAEARVS
ncbi:unnamed protein product [Boreogadus saida]